MVHFQNIFTVPGKRSPDEKSVINQGDQLMVTTPVTEGIYIGGFINEMRNNKQIFVNVSRIINCVVTRTQ